MKAIAKWQGAGNAYLVLHEDDLAFPVGAAQARLLCDPRYGIGADGLLLLGDSATADVRMRIVNPDGSAAEACGNGSRIVARAVAEERDLERVRIESAAGVLDAVVRAGGIVTVRMAPAALDGDAYRPTAAPFPYPHRFVSLGNPHVTIRVDDVDGFPLEREGPVLEHHAWLPQRANVEVWRRSGDGAVEMRVWERGVGETFACGSGACAVAVAAVLDGVATSPVDVRLAGGTLTIAVGDELEIEMTGPAEPIGEIALSAALIDALVTG